MGTVCRDDRSAAQRDIRRLRKKRELSQEALAERAEIAADYLGFIGRGQNVPTAHHHFEDRPSTQSAAGEFFRDFK